MERIFNGVQNFISEAFGWLFVLAVNYFLFFVLYLAGSKYGRIKLGGRDAVPDFSRGAWFAMLFSAGMGIGILFWSVAEPLFHFTDPPQSTADAAAQAQAAMELSFLHWGLHAWAVYSLVGMALAFFAFNRKEPLAIRSVFKPLLGKKADGAWGNVIDILAVVATLFGLATSLGFGVQQVSAGLRHLFGISTTPLVQILLVAAVTGIATLSVVSGMHSGVKRLSELNIRVGAVLLAFIFVVGPTVFILNSYLQNLGGYMDNFFARSFWTESYSGGEWQNSWTIFYWAWWISWSPFVGMFIARISKGRTIREFVLSVLVIPSLLTFFWINAFGGTAVSLQMQEAVQVADQVKDQVAISIFVLLEHYPLAAVTSGVAMLLVVSFFVTSADSGSLVVDSFASGGVLDTPVIQRVFWTTAEGALAVVLLLGGGLGALQAASISTGLPFAVLLGFMTFSLMKGLEKEHLRLVREEQEKEKESYQDIISDIVRRRTGRDASSGGAEEVAGNERREDERPEGDRRKGDRRER